MARRATVNRDNACSTHALTAMINVRHYLRVALQYLCTHAWSRPYAYKLREVAGEDEHVVHEGLQETQLCIKCHKAKSRWLT